MPREFIAVHCPCCGQKLRIDVKLETASAWDRSKERPKADLDDALRDAAGDKARLEGRFKEALDSQAKQKQHLESLFEDARKKAELEKDKKPPTPFDFD
jgi:hypothetical protein